MHKRDWEKKLFFSKLKFALKKVDWFKSIDLLLKIISLLILIFGK
ncbi:hypothetical protein [Clostridium sp.]|nr:hypothetical protein [uncultured Clostridium sp.]